MVNLLSQSHPVRGLHEAPVAKHGLRGRTSQDRIYDGEEVDLFACATRVHVTRQTRGLKLIVFVVHLLQLAEDHSSRENTVPTIVVWDVMELSEGRHTLKHVLHRGILVQIREKLAVVAYSLRGLVSGKPAEMAGCHCEDGVQQMSMFSGYGRHHRVKVPAFVAQIKLHRCQQ